MKLRLSTDEMLSQWRMRRALEPLRSDCTVERIDGIDLDSFLMMEMRDWYLNLLDTAPPHLLTLTDITSKVSLSKNDDLSATIRLPQGCRRVIELTLDCSPVPIKITPPDTPLAICQQNPFCQSGAVSPIAIHSNNSLIIHAGSDNFNIVQLLCVMEPDEGLYELDEAALSLISQIP
jgi:hypothetical protein